MERRSRLLHKARRHVSPIFLLPMKMGGWCFLYLPFVFIRATTTEKYMGMFHGAKGTGMRDWCGANRKAPGVAVDALCS